MSSLDKYLPSGFGKMFLVAAVGSVITLTSLLPADAQSRRPNSTAMTCAQVQNMINQRGAVVLSTGQFTFDRYVSNRNFCQHGEFLKREVIPTRDSRHCPVERCVNQSPFLFRD